MSTELETLESIKMSDELEALYAKGKSGLPEQYHLIYRKTMLDLMVLRVPTPGFNWKAYVIYF